MGRIPKAMREKATKTNNVPTTTTTSTLNSTVTSSKIVSTSEHSSNTTKLSDLSKPDTIQSSRKSARNVDKKSSSKTSQNLLNTSRSSISCTSDSSCSNSQSFFSNSRHSRSSSTSSDSGSSNSDESIGEYKELDISTSSHSISSKDINEKKRLLNAIEIDKGEKRLDNDIACEKEKKVKIENEDKDIFIIEKATTSLESQQTTQNISNPPPPPAPPQSQPQMSNNTRTLCLLNNNNNTNTNTPIQDWFTRFMNIINSDSYVDKSQLCLSKIFTNDSSTSSATHTNDSLVNSSILMNTTNKQYLSNLIKNHKPLGKSIIQPNTYYSDLFMNLQPCDPSFLLISSIVNDTIYQLYNECYKKVHEAYEKAQYLIKHNIKTFDGADCTTKEIWGYLVESIPNFVKLVLDCFFSLKSFNL